ncbi:hypothetical protein KEM55_007046, partial [Ascosphaera atra]
LSTVLDSTAASGLVLKVNSAEVDGYTFPRSVPRCWDAAVTSHPAVPTCRTGVKPTPFGKLNSRTDAEEAKSSGWRLVRSAKARGSESAIWELQRPSSVVQLGVVYLQWLGSWSGSPVARTKGTSVQCQCGTTERDRERVLVSCGMRAHSP